MENIKLVHYCNYLFHHVFYLKYNNFVQKKRKSKIFLGIAAILGLTSELPLNIWSLILPSNYLFPFLY